MQPKKLARVIAAAAVIAYVSLSPSGTSNIELFPHIDKVGHFFMYAVLSFFSVRTPIPDEKINLNRRLIITSLCAGYGLLLEIAQELMACGRTFEWYDAGANLAGAAFGIMIDYLFFKPVKNKNTGNRVKQ